MFNKQPINQLFNKSLSLIVISIAVQFLLILENFLGAV